MIRAMNGKTLQQFFGELTIKRFVFLWMGCLVICLIVLALALILSTNKLQSMTDRIFADSVALESAHQLEIVILAERREDLLWRITHGDRHYYNKDRAIKNADQIVKALTANATKTEKRRFIDAVDNQFTMFKTAAMETPPVAVEKVSTVADDLLKAVEVFRDQNRKQMMETVQSSEHLNKLVDLWSEVLIGLVTALAVFGSFTLIKRIVKPTMGLMETARKFGKGDVMARSNVTSDDEIGMLCKTFNIMAENLCRTAQNRQDFVAAVAHDIKNPLVVIGGAAALLKKKSFSPEEHGIWMDRIIGRVQYLELLINDLMDSVQLERGVLQLNLKEFDLTCLVQEILKVETEIITTHRIVFTGKEGCRINGDVRRIERVISNLITNAVKYSPTQSAVEVKVERCDGHVVMGVKDEGVGISHDDIPFLFQPYKRLRHADELAEGSGLGLFSVKGIVESHGGTIRIVSAPGKGTMVEILFPISCGYGGQMVG